VDNATKKIKRVKLVKRSTLVIVLQLEQGGLRAKMPSQQWVGQNKCINPEAYHEKAKEKKWGENEDERRKVKMKVWIGAGIWILDLVFNLTTIDICIKCHHFRTPKVKISGAHYKKTRNQSHTHLVRARKTWVIFGSENVYTTAYIEFFFLI